MPGYKVHQTAGVGFVLLVFLINSSIHFIAMPLGPIEMVFVAVITLFYSILPDIDIASSKSRQLVLGGGLLLILWSFIANMRVVGAITAILMLVMIFMLQHRGKTHTTIGGLIFCVPLLYLHWVYALIALVAYISHLVMDKELKWK